MTRVYTSKLAKHDFFDTAVADILRALDGGSLLGAAILSMCCIDYMGLAMNPSKKNTSSDFKKFVKNHMSQANIIYSNDAIAEAIYAVRNSLIHTYGTSDATEKMNLDFVINQDKIETHLKLDWRNNRFIFYLYLPHFIAEVVAGVESFFRESFSNQDPIHEWYNKIMVVLGKAGYAYRLEVSTNPGNIHARSHRLLAVLDEQNTQSIESIRNMISQMIKKLLNSKL
ncbi:hypothetical protein EHQ46_16120 [Leptospira yanagawae]|uniref:DUF4145 domain-containing protein n=1 Tax=Leptospira yanagawae TaxID=293069 RepID=A0ABY2LXV8_9LEPT|nr:hypothetical protein [Leptospira yanagawae]TGL17713.1 hypothetical protein EHQ46_16120 [Leptospira yanagawae]